MRGSAKSVVSGIKKIALFGIFFLFLGVSSFANGDGRGPIDTHIGKWQFSKMRFKGELHEIPNPDLQLIYYFYDTGNSRLFWTRKNERSFCERVGIYMIVDEKIKDLVVWRNPGSAPDCYRDPDMELGRIIEFPLRMRDGKLETDIFVGDNVITYIWTRQ